MKKDAQDAIDTAQPMAWRARKSGNDLQQCVEWLLAELPKRSKEAQKSTEMWWLFLALGCWVAVLRTPRRRIP
jgi:hypothetical protein